MNWFYLSVRENLKKCVWKMEEKSTEYMLYIRALPRQFSYQIRLRYVKRIRTFSSTRGKKQRANWTKNKEVINE